MLRDADVDNWRFWIGIRFAKREVLAKALGGTRKLDAGVTMGLLLPDELDACPSRECATRAAPLRDMLAKDGLMNEVAGQRWTEDKKIAPKKVLVVLRLAHGWGIQVSSRIENRESGSVLFCSY